MYAIILPVFYFLIVLPDLGSLQSWHTPIFFGHTPIFSGKIAITCGTEFHIAAGAGQSTGSDRVKRGSGT
jgi:hypothetical protein